MTRRDPQAMTGSLIDYTRPPGCLCGHAQTAHHISRDGKYRTSCSVHGRREKCPCRRYEPEVS